MEVRLLDRRVVNPRLGPGEPVDRVGGARRNGVGRVRLLDHAAQHGHRALPPFRDLNQNSGAAGVATALVADVDLPLVSETQRFDRRIENGTFPAGVDQRPQRHVARDAGKAVEVSNGHARVLLMRTAAASMGCMLAGRLATRTETDSTRGSASTFSAIAEARDSSSLRDSPSITSRAAALTAV